MEDGVFTESSENSEQFQELERGTQATHEDGKESHIRHISKIDTKFEDEDEDDEEDNNSDDSSDERISPKFADIDKAQFYQNKRF